MIEYFSFELQAFWRWLFPLLQTLVWPAIAVGAIILLARHFSVRTESKHRLSSIWVLIVTIGILATFQHSGLRAVKQYRDQQSLKKFDSKEVVSGSSINQTMPTVRLLITSTQKTTTLASVADLESYRTDKGIDYAQYLSSTRGVSDAKILSTVKLANGDVRIFAEYPRTREEAVTLKASKIEFVLDPVIDADPRANAYSLQFKATYEWFNETDANAGTRFEFQLPDHGGTINDVVASINGEDASRTDSDGRVVRETKLAPGGKATAVVSYNTKARGNFRFYPSDGLRSIPSLEMNLKSTADVRFERGSIAPSSQSNGEHKWKLTNSMTRQYVSIAIPYARGTQEIWWKLGYVAPLALVVFGCGIVLTGLINRPVVQLISGVVAFGVGSSAPLAFASATVSPILVGARGLILASVATWLIFGTKSWVVIIAAGAVILAPLLGPWSSLFVLLSTLGAAIWIGRSGESE